MNHDRTTAYIGEVREGGTWHVVRFELNSGRRESLPGSYDDRPGFAITNHDELLVVTPNGILKREL